MVIFYLQFFELNFDPNEKILCKTMYEICLNFFFLHWNGCLCVCAVSKIHYNQYSIPHIVQIINFFWLFKYLKIYRQYLYSMYVS